MRGGPDDLLGRAELAEWIRQREQRLASSYGARGTCYGTISRMAAIASVLFIIAIWWLATHGKGLVVARLLAWLLAVIVVLVFLSFSNPALAGAALSGFTSGLSQAAAGFGHFFKAL